MRFHSALLATTLLAVLLVTGCKPSATESVPAPAHPQPGSATAPAPVPAPAASEAASAPSAAASQAAFDIAKLPLSQVTLGEWPYLGLPDGYIAEGRANRTKAFARFPFWVNGAAHWVEGRFHEWRFSAQPGAQYSPPEVAKNVESMVQQLGGVKVSEGKIPAETANSWGDEITQGFIDGLGDVWNRPVTTYVVRRDDGNIWVHFGQNNEQGWMTLGQEKAFQPSAQLLPAGELKKQLDSAGKVTIAVHFDTDKTSILPSSQPQIDQVLQLLKDDPALRLSVNGHTDNRGDAAHNQALSEGRARAVVSALTGQGIEAARLTAQGFGDTQPVADNSSDEGRARNRRVELVKA